ncbi:MAG: MarR family transcriptional regulator [Bacteroidales bacterium]|nr:MarR family transcriptional regulator [Bacteroidales bacterium]
MPQDLAKNNPYMTMVVNILRTGSLIDHKVSDVLKPFDITHIQFNILRSLEAIHPEVLSVGDINNGLMFPTSDVTRLLDRLEKRALITRLICPENRRKMDISITDKGLNVIENALPGIEAVLDGYYRNNISENERDLVVDVLKRINNSLKTN